MEDSSCCIPSREPGGRSASLACKEESGGAHFLDHLISLQGGKFLMGTDDPEGWADDAEGPIREVEVSPFRMDSTTVTNAQFAEFVQSSGYRTEAEQFGWSYVFILQLPRHRRKKGRFFGRASECEWWIGVEGAMWKTPEGPGSDIGDRMDHPVVHVGWNDAVKFARWAGKRLPTEAEWEYAARGGLVQNRFPWGNDLTPGGRHMCNIWQGKFPEVNRPEDGYLWTAPAKAFEPNAYGLYQMSGNVWEWCADYWGTNWNGIPAVNPRGPIGGDSRVMRGGSYLCHKSYCNRYRVAARSKITPESTTSHMGFRCAADAI